MRRPQQPLYLARESYRRRRAMDAVRVLPFLGLFLFMLPLMWDDTTGPGRSTAFEGLYLYVVWAGLILAAAALVRRLPDRQEDDGTGEDRPPAPEVRPEARPEPRPDNRPEAERGAGDGR